MKLSLTFIRKQENCCNLEISRCTYTYCFFQRSQYMMEKVLKEVFDTDEVEDLLISSGGCISQGKAYRIGQRKMFIKTNSKEQVNIETLFMYIIIYNIMIIHNFILYQTCL